MRPEFPKHVYVPIIKDSQGFSLNFFSFSFCVSTCFCTEVNVKDSSGGQSAGQGSPGQEYEGFLTYECNLFCTSQNLETTSL